MSLDADAKKVLLRKIPHGLFMREATSVAVDSDDNGAPPTLFVFSRH
mgnify:CR=1 FL=1